jgi:hypothetical protein
MFMGNQLGKPVPSPVVPGQVSERFRQAVKTMAEREGLPIYQFDHKEPKDDMANAIRQQRPVRDGIVFMGVAPESQNISEEKEERPVRVRAGQDGVRQALLLLY